MGVYEAISERWGKAATERRLAEAIAEAYAKGVAAERARQEAQQQQDQEEKGPTVEPETS